MLTSHALEQHFKTHRKQGLYSDNFKLRLHRALSWLKKAEETHDLDTKFIFQWITFNALYARKINTDFLGDKKLSHEFLYRICDCDETHRVYNLIWEKFPQSIRLLLDNKYVFQPFWDFHNGELNEHDYFRQSEQAKEYVLDALEGRKTKRLLTAIFQRLYTLRNQVMHGGATYLSKANRMQLKDATRILADLLPIMIDITLENHAMIDWGEPFYPFIQEN